MTAAQLTFDDAIPTPAGRPRDVVWRCPRCPHTETQPAHVTDIVHLCGKGEHPTHLKQAKETDR